MFRSLDHHQPMFCKDGLLMVKWLKHVVIKVKIKKNNILLCWLKLETALLSHETFGKFFFYHVNVKCNINVK